jgi:hypothetical protein
VDRKGYLVLLREEVLSLRKAVKNIISITLGLLILLTFNNVALAGSQDDQKKVDSIKVSAENLFNEVKPVFEVDKKNYGLSDAESFSNAVLGVGVTYYIISEDSLNGKQKNVDPYTLGGYIFSIKIGDKAVGIFKVREIREELTIDGGSSYFEFEQDLMDAKAVNKNTGETKFVYDERFHLSGLAVSGESEYDFIPTSDHGGFGLTKGQMKSFSEILPQIEKHYKEMKDSDLAGGLGYSTSDTATDRGNLIFVRLGLGIITIGIGTVFVRRKHAM